MEIVRHRDAGGQGFANGTNDSRRRQVTGGIVILANQEDAGMMAARQTNKCVQRNEVFVVARKDNTIFLNRVRQVDGVVAAALSDVGGQQHIMPRCPQQSHQQRIDGIVVQVQSQVRWEARAFSSARI